MRIDWNKYISFHGIGDMTGDIMTNRQFIVTRRWLKQERQIDEDLIIVYEKSIIPSVTRLVIDEIL